MKKPFLLSSLRSAIVPLVALGSLALTAPAWAVSFDSSAFELPARRPKIVVPPFPKTTKTFTFSVDLAAGKLTWNTANPATYSASLAVKNIGTAPAGAGRVSFVLTGSKGALTAVSALDDEGLDINEEKQFSGSFKATLVKNLGILQKLTATAESVDPAESLKTNNTATLVLASPPPQPAIAAVMAKAVQNFFDQAVKGGMAEQFKAVVPPPAQTAPAVTEAIARPQPPKRPTLKEPADGGSVTTLAPVLNWTDNSPGKNYFRWYVLNPDNNQKVWERDWDRGETVDKLCANAFNQWICQYATVPAGRLEFDQSYQWTVEASNGKLNSGYASSSQFNVKYEYVPIKFRAVVPTEATSCTSPQVASGSSCVCPEGMSAAPAPTYCCPVGRFWNGSACVQE